MSAQSKLCRFIGYPANKKGILVEDINDQNAKPFAVANAQFGIEVTSNVPLITVKHNTRHNTYIK